MFVHKRLRREVSKKCNSCMPQCNMRIKPITIPPSKIMQTQKEKTQTWQESTQWILEHPEVTPQKSQ